MSKYLKWTTSCVFFLLEKRPVVGFRFGGWKKGILIIFLNDYFLSLSLCLSHSLSLGFPGKCEH